MSSGTAIYKILGVEVTASPEEIKKAYHQRAHERHPDKNPDDPEAEEKFRRVTKAYEVLHDPNARDDWHKKYGLGPVAGRPVYKEPVKARDELVCYACEVAVRGCDKCGIGLCIHQAFKVPKSSNVLCYSCKVSTFDMQERFMREMRRRQW